MPNPDEITSDKVLFGFVLMATAGRTGLRGGELGEAVSRLQAQCIAALLKDEAGTAREQMVERLRGLWAMYEEHDPSENPWDIGGSA